MTYSSDGSPGSLVGQQGDLVRWGQSGAPEFVAPASITGINPESNLSSLASVMIENSTALLSPLPTTFTDIAFDSTVLETNTLVVEHNNTNNDRIDIKKDGTYKIEYYVEGEVGSNDVVEFRMRANDLTVLSGSHTQTGGHYHAGIHEYMITRPFITTLSSGDFLSLQVQETVAGTSDIDPEHSIIVTLMEGVVGPSGNQGPSGADGADGSGITIQDEGSNIAGNPYNIINFIGSSVVASQNGSVADITITASGSVPPSFVAEATNDITTTSTSDILATSMTLTPPAGTYLVFFTTSAENDASNGSTFINIYSGGTIVSASEREREHNRADDSSGLSATARVTVNGSQAIEGRWRVSTDTGTLHERTLAIFEVDIG
jgi:hypothetical protein